MTYLLQLTVKGTPSDDLLFDLYVNVPWGWEEESSPTQTYFRIHCPHLKQALWLQKRLLDHCPELKFQIQEKQDQDWKIAWKEFFKPIVIADKFLILPPWEESDKQDPSLLPLYIEPQMAFGTGHHPTTSLCLETMVELFSQGKLDPRYAFLDVGTGSGILAIASTLLGLNGIGLDNDPVAINNAVKNSLFNHVDARVTFCVGTVNCFKKSCSFDLILANILAGPLSDMAQELTQYLSGNSCLILSGILHTQEESVIGSYQKYLSKAPKIIRKGEWSALVWS